MYIYIYIPRTVDDEVLEGRGVEEAGGEDHERVEPPPRLVQALTIKVICVCIRGVLFAGKTSTKKQRTEIKWGFIGMNKGELTYIRSRP